MKLRVVWIGKTKNPHLAKLCDDYIGRIQRFLPLQISEVKESGLAAALDQPDRIVVLDPKGKPWTSDQLAKFVERHLASDSRRLTFVVGDYGGLPAQAKQRADAAWSLSPMTFTHELARVLVLEQIYRALSIIHHLPYAK